ncbi:glycerol-3-phosphate acyltransferase 2, mitochondrial [Discoglossus pictus]
MTTQHTTFQVSNLHSPKASRAVTVAAFGPKRVGTGLQCGIRPNAACHRIMILENQSSSSKERMTMPVPESSQLPNPTKVKNRLWPVSLGLKIETIAPFLGKFRPFVGKCCQTCTPKSMESFFYKQHTNLGFHNPLHIAEEDTRFRGWLVRRLCCILFILERPVGREIASNLTKKICQHPKVQSVINQDITPQEDVKAAPSSSALTTERVPMEVLRILGEIQKSLSPCLIRLTNWLLLKIFSFLFLNVQLHRGQVATVQEVSAARPGIPLVFLSTHRCWLDRLLLPFLLFSQNLGVPRVVWDSNSCSPIFRSILQRMGAIFLPADRPSALLSKAVLSTYIEMLLSEGHSLLIYLECPSSPCCRCLSPIACEWVQQIMAVLQSGGVSDVLIVSVGISYDSHPDTGYSNCKAVTFPSSGIWRSLLSVLHLWSYPMGCARVDFAQPFSLQEYLSNYTWRRLAPPFSLRDTLLPYILEKRSRMQDLEEDIGQKQGDEESQQQAQVDRLILHALRAAVSCSAVMSSYILSALILHKHRQGVSLSRLVSDFTLLTEEILLRGSDVGFSGQRWDLVCHSVRIMRSTMSLLTSPFHNIYVLCRESQVAIRELGHQSANLLPVFLYEAIGACAIHALLFQVSTLGMVEVLFNQDEIIEKLLCILSLLPRTLLLQTPCQTSYTLCQDVLDKLIQCGLLAMYEDPSAPIACDTGRHFVDKLTWRATDDLTDSDSDCMEQDIKRYYKVGRSDSHADFFIFLCRLLRPVLWAYLRAAELLQDPEEWGQDLESAYVDKLYLYLQEKAAENGSFECAEHFLASNVISTFKDLGTEVEKNGALLRLAIDIVAYSEDRLPEEGSLQEHGAGSTLYWPGHYPQRLQCQSRQGFRRLEWVLGNHGRYNDNRCLLLEFCTEQKLPIANTVFQQKDRLKTTCMHPRSKHWHFIDYILVRQRDLQDVLLTRVMPSVECNTGYHLVHCKLRLHFSPKLKRKRAPKKKLLICKLQSAEVKVVFRIEFDFPITTYISTLDILGCVHGAAQFSSFDNLVYFVFLPLQVFDCFPDNHEVKLKISEPFLQKENCSKLLRFIQQFVCDA